MKGGPEKWTEDVIATRYAQGRGQGEGSGYQPWVRVNEFSSKGNQTRVPSAFMGRSIHTFSYVERAMYLHMEFEKDLLDYREQFPMDRRITLGAAKALGIRHPRYPETGVPLVMMLDALVSYRDHSGAVHLEAWDAKPSDKLARPRIKAKLTLHRAYCAYAGLEHFIFTEKSVSGLYLQNVELIRKSRPVSGEVDVHPDLFGTISDELLVEILSTKRRETIAQFCSGFDKRHVLEPGTSLRALYHLLWRRRLETNLSSQELQDVSVQRLKPGKTGGVR